MGNSKRKAVVVKDQPIRLKIMSAKNPEELEFFHQVAKRYESASTGTQRKWVKALNAKRKEFGLPTIACL